MTRAPAAIGGALLAVTVALAPVAGRAVGDAAEMLANPAQEARAERIGQQLRCLVCQNESIEDSGAPLAKDLRRIVRVQVADGRSDPQIMAWMVARYGSFVRLSPPFDTATLLLWGMPVLALLAGAVLAWLALRSNRSVAPPAPLDPDERARLAELTGTAPP